jgi:hypothetical protein
MNQYSVGLTFFWLGSLKYFLSWGGAAAMAADGDLQQRLNDSPCKLPLQTTILR